MPSLKKKIEIAAAREEPLALSGAEVVRVHCLLDWAERMLDSLNYENEDTDGGNSLIAAFEEA